MFWNVLRDAVRGYQHNGQNIMLEKTLPRMDPPIQTEYFLSGGATILTYTCFDQLNSLIL